MMELGKMTELEVLRFKAQGAYLGEKGGSEEVLLPQKEVPEDCAVGSRLTVFIYKDSGDRPVATLKKPLVEVGNTAFLEVVAKAKFGYFVDIGLERDVLLPFSEMLGSPEIGKKYLFKLYVDKSRRLAVTMKVRDTLKGDSPYKENDMVDGVIYSIHREHGAFVALDGGYDALLPRDEMFGVFEVGDRMTFRVARRTEDGRIYLSLRERNYIARDKDMELLLEKLRENDGFLPVNDHTDPEIVRKIVGMSKSAFKRAVGGLYRERVIVITEEGISEIEK